MTKVFDMVPSYEIEAECVEPLPPKELKNELSFMITHVLKGLQRTNFPISYKEIADVQQEYKELFPNGEKTKELNFIGPNTVTLQHENMSLLTEDDFMVTDKADGERKLLFISKNMKMYLIPTSGRVENMNCTLQPQKGLPIGPMVLDGEHVFKDAKNNMHNTFYAFDMYYLNIEPLTEVNKKNLSIDKNDVRSYSLPIRREILMRVVNTVFASIANLNENKYAIEYKQFLPFSPANCRMLYETPKPYYKDGLIFTPVHYGVGLTSFDAPISNKRTTWNLNFKWKPAEENTIDFYVDINPTPQKTITGKEYKIITLKSSYSAYPTREQSDYTVCPSVSVYQNFDVNSNGKKRIPFIGGRPYDVSAYLCNKYTNEEGNICTDGEGRMVEVIEHGSIVEFKYDITKEKGWRWTPIRVRWDKTDPNAYSTAVKNWISIHNPVTYEMLVAPTKETTISKSLRPAELDDKEYYTLKTEKGNLKEGKLMSDFHNDIKRMLIEKISEKVRSTTKRKPMLIDFACGKGGDLQKWEDAQCEFVLGIDINQDNLHNTVDGAFLRVVQKKMRKFKRREPELLPMLFVEGSSSLMIKQGDAIKHAYELQIIQYLFGMESTYPPMLSEQTRIPYGYCKKGFDIGSIQFALHYMFDSEDSIMNFVYNLVECIQVGGYFCATCFDGHSILDLLKDIKKGQIMSTSHDEMGTFKLSTDVKKDYVPFSNIQKQYENSDVKDISKYVALPIGVKQQSLNKDVFLKEYLVFAEYFIPLMATYGFELATNIREFPNGTGLFKTLHSKFKDMSAEPNQEAISYLNRYYIFQKTKHVPFQAIKVYRTTI